MFLLDGQPLAVDTPFSHDEIQYPANWLRLSTADEKAAIGITEVADPTPYDQRFYWDENTPKDHNQLIDEWVNQTKNTANTILSPSDWMVIRQIDNGTPIPDEWKIWREEVRGATSVKIAAIQGTSNTGELGSFIASQDYIQWPICPDVVAS
jgi:hypothetical protein